MKQRVFLALMMPFLFIKGFAQEVNSKCLQKPVEKRTQRIG